MDEMFENKWKDKKVEDILKEIKGEFGKGKGKKTEEEIEKGIDGFWEVVKEKEEKKKKMPIVMAMMPRVQMARRGGKSRFWKR